MDKQYFKSKIFRIAGEQDFKTLALELFQFQAAHNPVYNKYLKLLHVDVGKVGSLSQIPFMPISFFKSHKVATGNFKDQIVFNSSGTTGRQASKHHLNDLGLYEKTTKRGFERIYGPIQEHCVLALLPAYLERPGSSLIYMAEKMIAASGDPDSSFYLNETEKLYQVLLKKIRTGKKTLLLGVSFALLDFCEKHALPKNNIVVMETGGMKGRRKEVVRNALHAKLCPAFGVDAIHSEYGMTELMSQAYSTAYGRFVAPPWMQVFIRQVDDPFAGARLGKTGGLNIIDLANIDSCAFVETQDLGRKHVDSSFEVMGRFDNADIRGCNLMVI